MRKSIFGTVAVVAMAFSSTQSHAAPLYYMWMMGRVVDSGAPFTRSVEVAPGTQVEYQVWGQLAPIGSTNVQNRANGTQTINSLRADTKPQGGDGMMSMHIDLYQNPTDPVQADLSSVTMNEDPTPMPNDSWAGEYSHGAMEVRGSGGQYHDLMRIFPIHALSVYTGVDAEVIFTGRLSVPEAAIGSASAVQMRWSIPSSYFPGSTGGALAINRTESIGSGRIIGISPTTEGSSDPIVSFSEHPSWLSNRGELLSAISSGGQGGLILTAVPEPGSVMLAGVATLVAAMRRRRHTS